jgi:hypothetical protein
VQVHVSAAVPPDELFLPLLRRAASQGVSPALGLGSATQRAAQGSSVQGAQPPPPPEQGQAAPGEPPWRRERPSKPELPPALLAEEVLMYHRAASRLVEMCSAP